MKLEEIQELWSSDCVIDDTELDLESVKIPELHYKYLYIFSLYQELLKTSFENTVDSTRALL